MSVSMYFSMKKTAEMYPNSFVIVIALVHDGFFIIKDNFDSLLYLY